MVGMLPDQDSGEGAGVFVPFFGELANTGVLLPRLLARTGAALIFGSAERLPGGRGFHLRFAPASAATHSSDLATAAAALNEDIERMIRARPEQYLWSYRRYRIRPPGSDDPYKRTVPGTSFSDSIPRRGGSQPPESNR
jgi:KDO2-lipid IV(A) lauroyltransferase